MMGGYPSTEAKEVILRDVMFHLHSLEDVAQSILSATDAQYELIQTFFDGKGEIRQPSDKSVVLSHEKLSGSEQKTLAFIQNDICIQATLMKKTVSHLGAFFNQHYGSSVDSRSKLHAKKMKPYVNSSENRLEIIYLREEYEQQARKLRKTEKRLNELCTPKTESEISGRNNSDDSHLSSYEELHKQIKELEKILKQKDEEVQKKRNELDDLNSKVESLQKEVDRLSRDLEKVGRERDRLSNEKQSLNTKLDRLDKEKNRNIATLNDELSRLRGQIESKRALKTVFLYTHRRGELLSKVIVELIQMLELQFETQGMKLKIVDCEQESEIEIGKPVLVLCINASRLGTDVSNALTGIQGNGNVSVVVLHHKETHALPNQSSERVLTSMEYKALGGIIDMAFLSNKGIYPCDMNNHALSIIVDFILQRN